MEQNFYLPTVYVANVIGLTLIIILFFENLWRFKEWNSENKSIMFFLVGCAAACILDPLAYSFDGYPGFIGWCFVFFSNSLLYITNVFISYFWVNFMAQHLDGKITRLHKRWLISLILLGIIELVVNFFIPVSFSIDANNVYKREIGYFSFLLLNLIIVADGLIYYFRSRRKGGILKSFPVLGYIFPVVVAIVVQSAFYGVSVISAMIAVGAACILAGLQNERHFLDELTGLYNRFYLYDFLKKIKGSDARVSGLMVNVKRLSSINEKYGYQEGDKAIIAASRLLKVGVGDMGTAIRYTGNEFIVLVNTQADFCIKVCIEEIRRNFKHFQGENPKGYGLPIEIGYSKLDFKKHDINGFINTMAQQMRLDNQG